MRLDQSQAGWKCSRAEVGLESGGKRKDARPESWLDVAFYPPSDWWDCNAYLSTFEVRAAPFRDNFP